MKTHRFMEKRANEYLDMRRSLGFAIKIEGEELLRFARYADKLVSMEHLTTELAVNWAKSTRNLNSIYPARRLDLVRRFAKYLFQFDPETEIPPKGLLGPTHRRPSPYIYSDNEISLLLKAASKLGPHGGLRPKTFFTLFGLLVSTGIRITEALSLDIQDVNFEKKILHIKKSKFKKSRIVPFHPSVADHLKGYDSFRKSYHPNPLSNAFFLTERNTRQKYHKTLMTFISIRKQLKLEVIRGNQKYPRIHDLRHTFAVNRIRHWYDEGVDVNKKLPALTTYLGHVKISDTYWYLSAVPELLARASRRFEQYTQK